MNVKMHEQGCILEGLGCNVRSSFGGLGGGKSEKGGFLAEISPAPHSGRFPESVFMHGCHVFNGVNPRGGQ